MVIKIKTINNEKYIRNEFNERGFEDVDEWIGYLDEL